MVYQSLPVRLAAGVIVGAPDNPVVVVPGRSPLSIDDHTHVFLRALARGEITYLGDDDDTGRSLATLAAEGILHSDISQAPSRLQYTPTVADLTIRRTSPTLTQIVGLLSKIVWPLTTRVAIVGGLLQVIGWSLTVTVLMPVGSALRYILAHPVHSIPIVVAMLAISALLHESGHYAVARCLGHKPQAGMGLYLWGPVMFVDLSALEGEERKHRIRGDLAGTAVDGYLLSAAGVVYAWTSQPISAVVLITGCSMALMALRPGDKSDGYWAIRDWFGARRVSATWADPRALARCYIEGRAAERRFVATLIAAYTATSVLIGITLVRWATEIGHIAATDRQILAQCAQAGALYGTGGGLFLLCWRRYRRYTSSAESTSQAPTNSSTPVSRTRKDTHT